jgi:hypothetical protein
MVNPGERLINVVTDDQPKRLTGLSQQGMGWVPGFTSPRSGTLHTTGGKSGPHPCGGRDGTRSARRPPDAGRELQGAPRGRRGEDDGARECRPVMGRIGVARRSHITPRASGQTAIGSHITRAFGQPTQEATPMAAAGPAGAASHDTMDWQAMH